MEIDRGSYYSVVKDRFSRARVQAILTAYSNGVRDPDGLIEAAQNKQREIGITIGIRSENRFDRLALQMPIVKSVRNASPINDAYDGIDKWVEFTPNVNLPPLPVQVKSSDKRVEKYKESREFIALCGMEIVINCGPKISKEEFRKQFNSEVQRIKKIIKTSDS